MDAVDYKKLRDEQKAQAGGVQARRDARADGHRRRLLHRDRRRRAVAQLRHPRHRHVRLCRDPHPSDRQRHRRLGTKSQGQGHETTYAQIIATELGLPADNIMVEEGNTDTAPYGLGTYGSRSTPVSGAATAMAARKIKAKAQMIAAYMLEVHDDDLEWDVDRFRVKGNPERFKTMKELAWAAYHEVPPGMEPGLEAVNYYDPPNLTFPFGAYICVVDVDVDTGETKVRRFYALDDCGTRINPMIIEGQIHGGLTEAFGIAMGQEIHYDENGNVTDRVADGLLPADRGRDAEMGDRLDHDAVAASSDRRQGRRREPECRRRAVLLQRGERRLRVPRLDPHPDAARPLAHLDGGGEARPAWVSACRPSTRMPRSWSGQPDCASPALEAGLPRLTPAASPGIDEMARSP